MRHTGEQGDALVRLGTRLRSDGYAFTTPTPATIARVNARPENERARDLVGLFGWSRAIDVAEIPADVLSLMREAGILLQSAGLGSSALRLSTLGGDLFWHSAYPTVAADSVFFGPDTYRFAGAIEAALPALERPVRRAADIGCGAGPGGILVAKACPDADVAMLDINETALDLARVNATLASARKARAITSDLLSGTDGEFDLIVSNPPYLNDPLERAYRHGGGAFGEALSLRILDASLARLAPGGTLVLYTGVAIVAGRDAFAEAAFLKLDGAPFVGRYREFDPDVFGEELEMPAYARVDRIAAVVLTVTRTS